MRLVDYLDKGASLGEDRPCLTMNGRDLSYREVRRLSWRIARGLAASGVAAGDKVAILSSNDPIAFLPLLCHRNPATTQSAVRECFTLIIARLPGR